MAHDADDGDVVRLNALLSKWREPKMQRVLPRLVIPDATNRANSGVSRQRVAVTNSPRSFPSSLEHARHVVLDQLERQI